MNKLRLPIYLAILTLAFFPSLLLAQAPAPLRDKPLRELFVPFEELDVLLGKDSNRVYMTRAEYEQMVKLARRRPELEPPLKQALLSATYRAAIDDGRANIVGELEIDLLAAGWQTIPLSFAGVGIRTAELDDAPAALAKDEKGRTMLFLQGVGKHRLTLDMVLPVEIDAAQQTLQFQLPNAPVSSLVLSVTGNVEIKSGAVVISRAVNAAANTTQFDILPTAQPMSILMSLNNKKLREQSTVIARGVLLAELTQGYERLHTTMSMGVLNGAIDEFRFAIADDLEVTSVAGELLSRWSVEMVEGQKQLVVKLRSPSTERVVINARLDRLQSPLNEWHFPTFEPIDVAGYSAVIGLLCEDRLNAAAFEPEALIAIDSDVLKSALPSSLLAAEPDAPQLRALAAFYAPQPQYKLAAKFTMQPSGLNVTANSLVTLSDQGQVVSGGFSLLPEHEKLFFVDLLCPADWSIDWVRAGDQTELKFDRFPTTEAEAGQDNPNATRIRVLLPAGVPAGTQFNVLFHARHTPADWLSNWVTSSISLPHFPLLGADRQAGAVAVELQDDLQVTPETADGLLVMNNDEKALFHLTAVDTVLAYRYDSPTWQAVLKVSHVAPRLTGHVMSFIQLHPESSISHTELSFNVNQARSQQVTFSLPDSTPGEVSIRGLGGVIVKESNSTIVDNRRVWKVQLAERQSGNVRLAIDFTERLDTNQKLDLSLPIVRAESVDYQSGTIAVEGHAELEIDISQHPRAVDIGELVHAEYQVGKRLLGAYGYVGNQDVLTASIARIPVHRLPTTIVERAELVTMVSAQGISQTVARFRLRTKATYLEARLPADAQLWSAMLDGKPALPQRQQDRLLIPLLKNQQSSLRDLQLVYETPIAAMQLRGQVKVVAPELFERHELEADEMSVPIADVKWEWLLPSGYRVTAVDGNLANSGAALDTFSMQWLLNKLWTWGGGRTRILPSVYAARSSARGGVTDEYVASAGIDASSESAAMGGGRRSSSTTSAPQMNQPMREMQVLDSATIPLAPAAPIAESAPVPAPAIDNLFDIAPASKPQSAAPARVPPDAKRWALEGVRSLAIDINPQTAGENFLLTSLGVAPHAEATIVNQTRIHWLALATGLAVFFVGVLIVSRDRQARYLFCVGLMACLVPLLTGWDVELSPVTASVLVALLLLIVFGLLRSLWTRFRTRTTGSPLVVTPAGSGAVTASAIMLLIGLTAGSVQAQDNATQPGQIVANPEQLAQLLSQFGGAGTVTLPPDAVVIPYDPTQSADAMNAEKLLVPYQIYTELWNSGHPDQKIDGAELPASYAWFAGSYSVELVDGDSLRMIGRLSLEQFTDRELAIPLNLSGCVLENATLDGKPPRLQMIQAQPAVQQAVAPNAVPNVMFVLHTQGAGRKQLELTLRWKLDKNSGWRVIDGIVPASPACQLTVKVPQAKTEVRLSGGIDRTLHETSQPDEQLVTAISSAGRLALQWRDKITEASVDQGLTVQARSVLDIQEDSLKFAWHGDFEFRRGRRESLTLQLPNDYLVQKVVGNNIRGWTTKVNGTTQQLDVELLKAVAERESFSIFISKQSALDPVKTTEVVVPQIDVPDAMLQQGHVAVRRSLLLDLHTDSADGLTRIDVLDESPWLAAYEEPGPLALRAFQAYRYSQVPFELMLSVNPIQPKVKVQQQSLLKISQRERTLETRLLIDPSTRPIFAVQIDVPVAWKLQPPGIAGDFQWSITTVNDRQRLNVYLANGQSKPFPILLQARVEGPLDADAAIKLPRLEVIDAGDQSGAIVVQADPAYDVRTEDLQGCEMALLDSVNTWVAAKQRESARAVVRFRNANYSGSLRVSERAPIVNSLSVTNVKVTDRAIEETIYIESNIRSAGIREFNFQLPASLADAKIQAPLLRQKNILPIANRTDVVRVQILLQNEILGQFRVVVEHDRELTDKLHTAPVPVIETGTTDRRLVTLENAGRDELVPSDSNDVEKLERSQLQQRFQTDLLRGKSSEAYLVREDSNEPVLSYQTKAREVLMTVGARIGLAQALVVIDELGTYRGTQEYRVENRTEPFLEIELPDGARLWTVHVAGEPVKPAMATTASSVQSGHVRVPLVKTAEGDLDYPVVLKYGGQVAKPSWWTRVEIPLAHTVNINVELSQVRLRLPVAFEWFNFDGTLGRVESEGDLQAGFLSFRTRQLSDLTQLLSPTNSASAYSKARASNNLKQLDLGLDTFYQQQQARGTTAEWERQRVANSVAIETARQQVAAADQPQADNVIGNRSIFNGLYDAQVNGRSMNALDTVGQNFELVIPEAVDGEKYVPVEEFQREWFAQNKLEAGQADEAQRERMKSDFKEQKASDQQPTQAAPEVTAGKKIRGEKSNLWSDLADSDADSQSQLYRQRLEVQSGRQAAGLEQGEMMGEQRYTAPIFGDFAVPQDQPARSGQIMFGGAVNPDAGVAGPHSGLAVSAVELSTSGLAAGYLASLDVELPQRGREYLFSTPRGDGQLSVQGISQRDYQRLLTIATLLLIAAVVWLTCKLMSRLKRTVWGKGSLVVVLTLFGVLSLVLGYLPIYGILAILAAIVIAVSRNVQLGEVGQAG